MYSKQEYTSAFAPDTGGNELKRRERTLGKHALNRSGFMHVMENSEGLKYDLDGHCFTSELPVGKPRMFRIVPRTLDGKVQNIPKSMEVQ